MVFSLYSSEPSGEVLIKVQILPVQTHRAKVRSAVIKSDKKNPAKQEPTDGMHHTTIFRSHSGVVFFVINPVTI